MDERPSHAEQPRYMEQETFWGTTAMGTYPNHPPYDVEQVRAMFPILERKVQGKPLVYLDHAATSHKPRSVIQSLVDVYSAGYSNIHRGAHTLAREATEAYEGARASVARFLHADDPGGIVFTSGATEALNLLAYGWARRNLLPGDRIAVTLLEHHANIVPWQEAARATGALIDWVGVTADGQLDMDSAARAIGPCTRLVCATHLSNVTGAWTDVHALAQMAQHVGARLILDGSQAAAHAPVHVQGLGCDAYVVTGHKLCGPSGSGAVWIHPSFSAEMDPFHTGGGMVGEVALGAATWAEGTARFEAGTPGIANQIAFGVALDTLMGIGMDRIAAHGAQLARAAQQALRALPFLELQGDHPGKAGIFSFTGRNGQGAEDIGTLLDAQGIAVRAGRHCAHPLLAHWGLASTCRASFGLTTTEAEIATLVRGLEKAHDLLG